MTRTLRLLAAVVLLLGAQAPQGADQRVLLLKVHGPIGPAISDYVERGLERAAAEEAAALVLELDTPGGLDTSMRTIIKAILAAPVPVVTYVAPAGARAASAGTYIVYASHVAAMAPATTLGAATPIPIGPGMLPGGGRSDDDDATNGKEKTDGKAQPEAAMEHKIVNDAAAYLRALAELRGRNEDWAEKAVREGASLSSESAHAEGVIDILATDLEALIEALDGREVQVGDTKYVLETAEWVVETVVQDWRTELLAVLTNPNVAYILLLLGVYGILFELYSPGALVPGIVGVISLVLALYALHLLPVNYAGAALLILGIAMMAAELFTPSFGAIGAGGVVAFVAGSIMLFDTEVEGLKVSMPLVGTVSLAFAGLLVATVVLFARQRTRPVVTGREQMIGSIGRAAEAFSGTGHVYAHGELWAARTPRPVAAGDPVRIRDMDGLTLNVEPLEPGASEEQRET